MRLQDSIASAREPLRVTLGAKGIFTLPNATLIASDDPGSFELDPSVLLVPLNIVVTHPTNDPSIPPGWAQAPLLPAAPAMRSAAAKVFHAFIFPPMPFA